MKITDFENPYIRVVWEDVPENFTKERIKRVKTYFSERYNSKHVTIVTKSQKVKGESLDIDLDLDVMSYDNQKKLMKEFLESNGVKFDFPSLDRLDNKVNEKLELSGKYQTRYRTIKVKSIEFSNFLSFGDNNIFKLEGHNGITVIDSNPPNFGGKTVLAVDLLLFLFFNDTTKTSKAIEIFNRFRDKNEVVVQGEIEIDGLDYVITRKVIRKETKKGDWAVKTDLEFYEKLPDGTLRNFTGEQRRETENFIKESIGSVDDFLITILTTGSNLESLIESKPTERGNILFRFIGLETLREKEKICKEIYNDWSKKLISNTHDIQSLTNENEQLVVDIDKLNDFIVVNTRELSDLDSNLIKLRGEKDELLSSKYSDVDSEISKLDVNYTLNQKIELEGKHQSKLTEHDSIEVVEPSQYFDPIAYSEKNTQKRDMEMSKMRVTSEINSIIKEIDGLENSQICPSCKRSLEGVDNTESILQKNSEKIQKESELVKVLGGLEQLSNELFEFEKLKNELDIYDKNKLIKEKKKLECDSILNEIEKIQNRLDGYELNKKKVEHNRKVESEKIKLDIQISTTETKKSNLQNEINRSNLNLFKFNEKLKENNKNIEKIKKEEEIKRVFENYLLTFGKNGISKTILKTLVPTINNELNRLMSDNLHFTLEIGINDKNEVEFVMVDKDSQIRKDLSSGSGFEKTVSSLGLRAVLTRFSSLPKLNICVFDEVFGKVSNENLEMVGEFFTKLKEYFDNIILITHNPLVNEWGDRLITVQKENNISRI